MLCEIHCTTLEKLPMHWMGLWYKSKIDKIIIYL